MDDDCKIHIACADDSTRGVSVIIRDAMTGRDDAPVHLNPGDEQEFTVTTHQHPVVIPGEPISEDRAARMQERSTERAADRSANHDAKTSSRPAPRGRGSKPAGGKTAGADADTGGLTSGEASGAPGVGDNPGAGEAGAARTS